MTSTTEHLIAITGGAGLVGQNLVIELLDKGFSNLLVIDKNLYSLNVLRELHPKLQTIHADLSSPGTWQPELAKAKTLVMLQAQISATSTSEFRENTIRSTELVLETIAAQNPHLIHISSSVVNSVVEDDYVKSKKQQEEIVLNCRPDAVVLRPTLMFGWFDRKHLGWLSRFMGKSPVFPVPGDGRFMRQPLYARDFCRIILRCIENNTTRCVHNISGQEQLFYIDMIRHIKRIKRYKTLILHIPPSIFSLLLRIYAMIDRNPPFTDEQLTALMTDETFEIIDWENIFSIKRTPFETALEQTLTDPKYSQKILRF